MDFHVRQNQLGRGLNRQRRRVQSHLQDEGIGGLPQRDDGDAAGAPRMSRVVCRWTCR